MADLDIYEKQDKVFTVTITGPETGTAQAGTTSQITLKSGSSASDDFYNTLVITLTGGTGVDQSATISDYNGTTKVATASFSTAPDSSTTYSIAATPINITGYTFLFVVKENMNDTDANATIKKQITSHSDPTNGVTEITLVPDDTDGLSGKYVYDYQWLDTSSKRRPVLKRGKFIIEQGVGDSFS